MSREKQIEEMANAINEMDEPNAHYYGKHMEMHEAFADCFTIAKHLYNVGYRKQSEGEWVSNRQTDEYICSLCNGIAPVDCEKERFYKSNFCPNCGAKMKGGAE